MGFVFWGWRFGVDDGVTFFVSSCGRIDCLKFFWFIYWQLTAAFNFIPYFFEWSYQVLSLSLYLIAKDLCVRPGQIRNKQMADLFQRLINGQGHGLGKHVQQYNGVDHRVMVAGGTQTFGK